MATYYSGQELISGKKEHVPKYHGTSIKYIPRGKKVRNTKTGEIYPSVTDAAKAAGVHFTTMIKLLNNKKGYERVSK